MKNNFTNKILFLLLLGCFSPLFLSAQEKEQVTINGLKESVEILRDQWGVNHIYAKNQHDLFFAQGYCAARDRLFQFEIWRRQATGTIAEIFGEHELKRDIGTRLFKFRGNMQAELSHYHPDGTGIITAYTNGVNAYIEEILKKPEKLPVEFRILGIAPKKWTPEVVISRHQGLKGNVDTELNIGRAVTRIGAEKVKELMWFHPNEPDLELDPKIKDFLNNDRILELHEAYDSRVYAARMVMAGENESSVDLDRGSNNWVLSGVKTKSGHPIMANDPHRRIAIPSLRYAVHLVAPGWNVIGGGEPEIPGVSIGHNEYGAWGLTIFSTDGEDLYIYDLNPQNLSQYRYRGKWEDMQEIKESIPIKNDSPRMITLRYTRHGPVTYIDSLNRKAYAVRCAWLEPGGAPYLASLRMDQAKSWEEFREACSFSNIPAENMVWADQKGNIGWQAVGITPVRKNFSGLVPVPGDGTYEWGGYLPIKERPSIHNPASGFFATANEHVTPKDYQHTNTQNYLWADPFRGQRINEVLSGENLFSLEDIKDLQSDYYSIPARTLVPMLEDLQMPSREDKDARDTVLKWNYKLTTGSVGAGIYAMWERTLKEEAEKRFIPKEAEGLIDIQLHKIIEWLRVGGENFGPRDREDKAEFLRSTFTAAIAILEGKLGEEMTEWKYGQEAYKHSTMSHMLSSFVDEQLRHKINAGPHPRGGNSYTPNSTGNEDNQGSGASFKFITDVGDWDKALMINTPGQSGDPASPYYKNIFKLWATNQYFPAYYSREKVEEVTREVLILNPEN